MTGFDPNEYQISPNGPLRPEVIKRLVTIKERTGMAYNALGGKLGISGTFLHNIINKEANIGTQHVERIAQAIAHLENPGAVAEAAETQPGMLEHSFHLRPGLQIAIELPVDLSDREAERLARFIQAIPLS